MIHKNKIPKEFFTVFQLHNNNYALTAASYIYAYLQDNCVMDYQPGVGIFHTIHENNKCLARNKKEVMKNAFRALKKISDQHELSTMDNLSKTIQILENTEEDLEFKLLKANHTFPGIKPYHKGRSEKCINQLLSVLGQIHDCITGIDKKWELELKESTLKTYPF